MRGLMMKAAIGFMLVAMAAGVSASPDATAIAAWRKQAASGDTGAQYDLGQAYRQGNGVPEDPIEAESWYRRAAEHGHALAQARLGLMLFTQGRRAESYAWLEKAAAQGEPRAQYVMGNALFNGNDLPRDWPRAYAMMTRAAAAGLAPAKRSLATMESFIAAPDRQMGATLADRMALRETVPPAVRQEPADRPAPAATPVDMAPTPVRIAETRKPAPPARGWHVQLGAFGQEGAAQSYWASLSARPELRGLAPIYVTAPGRTRLQVGPFADRVAANDACAAIRRSGNACFPVAP